jgi:hypothetical protein
MDDIFLLTEVNQGFNIEIAQKASLPALELAGEAKRFPGPD